MLKPAVLFILLLLEAVHSQYCVQYYYTTGCLQQNLGAYKSIAVGECVALFEITFGPSGIKLINATNHQYGGQSVCDSGEIRSNNVCQNTLNEGESYKITDGPCPAICGNGQIDGYCTDAPDTSVCTLSSQCDSGSCIVAEECDDGNLVDGDACSSLCTLCGNGVLDPGEHCEDGNTMHRTAPQNQIL
jgi:cysteine-rich repeat protein